MTKDFTYRGFTVSATATTIGKELIGAKANRKLLKITDANGHAIRNAHGSLPIITTRAAAKMRIDEELRRA